MNPNPDLLPKRQYPLLIHTLCEQFALGHPLPKIYTPEKILIDCTQDAKSAEDVVARLTEILPPCIQQWQHIRRQTIKSWLLKQYVESNSLPETLLLKLHYWIQTGQLKFKHIKMKHDCFAIEHINIDGVRDAFDAIELDNSDSDSDVAGSETTEQDDADIDNLDDPEDDSEDISEDFSDEENE